MSTIIDGVLGVTTSNIVASGTGTFASTVGVGNTTPANTGSGITFPATQSASSNPNTLDDYEEGTYTSTFSYSSTLTSTSPTATGTVNGDYVKIGRLVQVNLAAINQASTGNIVLFSFTLPFTASSGRGYFAGYGVSGRYGSSSFSTWYPQVEAIEGTTTANLFIQVPGAGSGYPSLETGGTAIGISINYIAAA